MPQIYNVHLYREMRLYFPGIEAASHQEAARIAAQKLTDDAETIEDCEGANVAALVDVQGDDEYIQSRVIDFPTPRKDSALGLKPSNHERLAHACRLLVEAYAKGAENGAHVDWDDVDRAHDAAQLALGIAGVEP